MLVSRALAQCPGTQPAFSAVVNEQPSLLQSCSHLNTQGGCLTPDPPIIETSRTHAQETSLQATVPTTMTATSAHWMVERRNGSVWEDVWRHKSIQGAPHAPGSIVTFGAPGLVENAEHRIRVGFCNEHDLATTADDECTCWSPADASFTTTAFADLGPAKPAAPMLQKVEDQFDRPDTDPKCRLQGTTTTLGDGLGPPEVWEDCLPNDDETVTIKDESGWTTPSSQMYYARRPATSPNSYTDLNVRVDDFDQGASAYNLEVGTRIIPVVVAPGVIAKRGYFLKLVLGVLQCTQPTMMLARFPDEYDPAKCAGGGYPGFPYLKTLPSQPCPAGTPDPARANKCDCAPPLNVADGQTGYGRPVWMRVEAWDDPLTHFPSITGAVAWGNCPAGQPMSACDYYCTFAPNEVRNDDDDTVNLRGVIGTWGAAFHEKKYSVDVFEAGSHPGP